MTTRALPVSLQMARALSWDQQWVVPMVPQLEPLKGPQLAVVSKQWELPWVLGWVLGSEQVWLQAPAAGAPGAWRLWERASSVVGKELPRMMEAYLTLQHPLGHC